MSCFYGFNTETNCFCSYLTDHCTGMKFLFVKCLNHSIQPAYFSFKDNKFQFQMITIISMEITIPHIENGILVYEMNILLIKYMKDIES